MGRQRTVVIVSRKEPLLPGTTPGMMEHEIDFMLRYPAPKNGGIAVTFGEV